MIIKSKHLLDSARKAGAWLSNHQTNKGNYIGREKPDEYGIYSDTDDLACYYKSFYFLRIVGESITASRGMSYVINRFMTKEGDFVNSDKVRSSGTYTSRFCHLYPNAFLMRAIGSLGWYGYGKKMLEPFLKTIDYETGGFYALVTPGCAVINSDSTALGALSCLICGEIGIAVKSGDFLLKLLSEQPDSTKLYGQWQKDKGFLTDIENLSDKDKKAYYIDSKISDQFYWIWGWPFVFLIKLYEHTGMERFLNGAINIYDFLLSCQDPFNHPSAGKSSWGSAMLYRITGDKRYLKSISSQVEWMMSQQHKDGYMLQQGAKSESDQPIRICYDFTADWGTWLVDDAVELSCME